MLTDSARSPTASSSGSSPPAARTNCASPTSPRTPPARPGLPCRPRHLLTTGRRLVDRRLLASRAGHQRTRHGPRRPARQRAAPGHPHPVGSRRGELNTLHGESPAVEARGLGRVGWRSRRRPPWSLGPSAVNSFSTIQRASRRGTFAMPGSRYPQFGSSWRITRPPRQSRATVRALLSDIDVEALGGLAVGDGPGVDVDKEAVAGELLGVHGLAEDVECAIGRLGVLGEAG